MNMFLSFESPLEFLLRYTVIVGIAFAMVGTAICLLAKKIVMVKRKTDSVERNDSLYATLMFAGLICIIIGMIIIALPIENTLYVG